MLNPIQPYFFLLTYIVVLYIRPQEYLPSFAGSPVVPALLGFTALFWLVAQRKNFDAAQHRLMPGLAVAMFASVALTGWMSGAVGAIVEFAPTIILYYVVSTSVDSIKRFREMSLVLTAVCCVLALHGVEQIATEDGIGWTGAATINGRITYLGFLNDPNDLAMAFLVTLPLTMYLATTSQIFVLRLAYYAAASLLAYGIYLCNSRGSMLALASMLFAYSIRQFGWLRSVIVAPLLGLPLILLAPSRLGEISADEESAAGRIDAWFEGFEMFRSHPLTGIGKGLFTDHNPLTAHNSFVLAIAELGVFGYFFWISILAISALMLYQILTAKRESATAPDPGLATDDDSAAWDDWQQVSRTLMYAYIGTMVTIFFLSRTYTPVLYLLIALIVAAHQAIRARWPLFSPVTVRLHFKTLLKVEVLSIVGMWVVTRVLLSFS